MKTIGIIGSRRRDSPKDYKVCEKTFLQVYENGDEIVSGGCPRGGDRFAEIIAKKFQVPIKIYYAQWDKHGKGAGFIRNTYIARDSDILISLVSPDRKGGAEDTIKKYCKTDKKDSCIILELEDKFEDKSEDTQWQKDLDSLL